MGDVYPMKTEANSFKMERIGEQRPQYSSYQPGHCTWGKFKQRGRAEGHPNSWQSNITCDVRARMRPKPGARGGPCARECGAGRFLDSPADLTEPLGAADVGCKQLCGRFSIIQPTDQQELREDRIPFSIFNFTLLAPIVK